MILIYHGQSAKQTIQLPMTVLYSKSLISIQYACSSVHQLQISEWLAKPLSISCSDHDHYLRIDSLIYLEICLQISCQEGLQLLLRVWMKLLEIFRSGFRSLKGYFYVKIRALLQAASLHEIVRVREKLSREERTIIIIR